MDEAALSALIRHINERHVSRSFRRTQDLAEELIETACGKPVTVELVRDMLALV